MSNSLDYVWVAGDPVRIGLIPEDLLEMLECAADGVVVEALDELFKLLSDVRSKEREYDFSLDDFRFDQARDRGTA